MDAAETGVSTAPKNNIWDNKDFQLGKYRQTLDRFQLDGQGKYIAECPFHDDQHPSLRVDDKKGPWLWFCDPCGEGGDIRKLLQKLGRSIESDFPKKEYIYTDAGGNPLHRAVRFYEVQQDGKRYKRFFQNRFENGHWVSDGPLAEQCTIYKLPAVLKAEQVLVLEGEKDVETAIALGFVATTNPMGAGKWQDKYSELLKGKDVFIIPDDDEIGRKHAQQVLKSVTPHARSVKLIPLPAKDLTEWVEQGGTAERLKKLMDATSWRRLFKTQAEMEPGDMKFLISQFLPEGVCFIGGLPAGGKTWVALSIAKALSLGADLFGHSHFKVPESVPVIYMIPESGERAFRNRIEKMRLPSDERFLCRTMCDGVLPLNDPELLAAVRQLRPVIFLDTLVRFSDAENENDARENVKGLSDHIFRLIQAGARAVVALHHSTKSSSSEEMTLENCLRGSTELAAIADCVYGLKVINAETLQIKIRCVKPRDFEPVPPFCIQGRPFINELGDFGMLAEPGTSPEKAEVEKLASAIKLNPKASYRQLEEATGVNKDRVSKVARKAGLEKVGELWIQQRCLSESVSAGV